MPAHICRWICQDVFAVKGLKAHTNFKVMLVRQRILNSVDQRLRAQNPVRHLVHGILDTGAVVLGESLEGDIPGDLPGRVELVCDGADLVQSTETLPIPVGSNISAEDAVPCLFQGGVFVTDEAVELGAGALEHSQVTDRGLDIDALALNDIHLDVAGLIAILVE